jgi:hypothetical protein
MVSRGLRYWVCRADTYCEMPMTLPDTIDLTGVQAVALRRQVHASMALAAAASVDGDAGVQALARFDRLHAISDQLGDGDLDDGANVLSAPAMLIELVELALSDAGPALGQACTRDPVSLADIDCHLERVVALRDLIALIEPLLDGGPSR